MYIIRCPGDCKAGKSPIPCHLHYWFFQFKILWVFFLIGYLAGGYTLFHTFIFPLPQWLSNVLAVRALRALISPDVPDQPHSPGPSLSPAPPQSWFPSPGHSKLWNSAHGAACAVANLIQVLKKLEKCSRLSKNWLPAAHTAGQSIVSTVPLSRVIREKENATVKNMCNQMWDTNFKVLCHWRLKEE